MTSSQTIVPGLVDGAWTVSPANSEVRFTVRHLGVSRAHGRFKDVTGVIVTSELLERSSVTATIAAESVDTGFAPRDAYLRGDDVLAAGVHRQLRFTSTGIRPDGGSLLVDGELTIRDITRPITLAVEVGGIAVDPVDSVSVLGLSATTTLRRNDFDLGARVPALIVGDDVTVQLDIHAARTS